MIIIIIIIIKIQNVVDLFYWNFPNSCERCLYILLWECVVVCWISWWRHFVLDARIRLLFSRAFFLLIAHMFV